MFKYLWLVVIVIFGIGFIAYTLWALSEALHGEQTLFDALIKFADDHNVLVEIWIGIFITLVIFSFIAYCIARTEAAA